MPEESINEEIRNENEKPKNQKEELAKTFGIDLKDIEHISINDGAKEFFKIFNPKDRSIRLIEVYGKGNDVQKHFEEIQKGLTSAQGDDAKSNARDVFEHELKYEHNEVNLISIAEFKSRVFRSKRLLRNLDTITRKKVLAIIKGCRKSAINLKYINLENAIGVDEKGSVIEATYDYVTNKAYIKGAKVINTKDQVFDIDKDIDEVVITSEALNGVFENIAITDDGPTLVSDRKITIKDTEISTKKVIDFYNMPELMDKETLSSKEREIYNFILGAIVRKVSSKKIVSEQNENGKARQLKPQININNNEESDAA